MNTNNFDFYVINLDKDVDRLKELEQNLYPNKFIRVPGVYGKEMNFENNKDIFFTSRYLVPKSVLGSCLSHQKAIKTFLNTSSKDYAVILEDDAIPNNSNYINEINDAINNAPSNWDIIKLDFTPVYNNDFNKYFSLLATSYIINKKSANKLLENKIFYYFDFDMNFYNLNLYNNTKIVFKQDWSKDSNNKNVTLYNPFDLLNVSFTFKCIRILNKEYSFSDLFLFLLFFVLFIISILNYRFIYKFVNKTLFSKKTSIKR
jgi:GR25 family glycosyltransferase involved in LPS biosynthesis